MSWFSPNRLLKHPGLLLTLFLGVLLPLIAFGKIAEEIRETEGIRADPAVLLWIHARSSPGLDDLALFFSTFGGPVVLTTFGVLVFAALWYWRGRSSAIFFGLASLGAVGLNLLAKPLFHRSRPALWSSIAPETDFSFPSGHAMISCAVGLALVLLLWNSRWRWLALILGAVFILGIGASRLYLGVHYPSDVLGGWAAALAWVVGTHQRFVRGGKASAAAQPSRA